MFSSIPCHHRHCFLSGKPVQTAHLPIWVCRSPLREPGALRWSACGPRARTGTSPLGAWAGPPSVPADINRRDWTGARAFGTAAPVPFGAVVSAPERQGQPSRVSPCAEDEKIPKRPELGIQIQTPSLLWWATEPPFLPLVTREGKVYVPRQSYANACVGNNIRKGPRAMSVHCRFSVSTTSSILSFLQVCATLAFPLPWLQAQVRGLVFPALGDRMQGLGTFLPQAMRMVRVFQINCSGHDW